MSESSAESSARRTLVRRLLAPGLAMLAVAGVTAGAVLVVQHRTPGGPGAAGNPPPLNLVGAAQDGAVLDSAVTDRSVGVGAMPGGGAPIAPLPAPVGFGPPTVAGPLPTGPAREKVRTLPAGAAPADTVGALARALGLSGTPTRTAPGWQLTDGDRTLQAADIAGMPWLLGGRTLGGGPACHVISSGRGRLCPPGIVLPPQPAPQGGGGSSGQTGPGSGAGGAPAPGVPANGAGSGPASRGSSDGGSAGSGSASRGSAGGGSAGTGAVSSGSTGPGAVTSTVVTKPVPLPPVPVPGRPIPAPYPVPPLPLPPVPAEPIPAEPVPVPSRPTDAGALLAARPVLAALGLGDAATRVLRLPGLVVVQAEPVVDGLPTSGYDTLLAVAPGGTVTSGHGWLARPVAGAEYPLVSAADAVNQLAVPDLARLCGRKVCPTPPIVITGARLGLTLRWNLSGQPLLVPAWRYDVRGQQAPLVVVAVQPAYLGGGSGQSTVPGVPLPAPVYPKDGYPNGGAPGQEPATPPTR